MSFSFSIQTWLLIKYWTFSIFIFYLFNQSVIKIIYRLTTTEMKNNFILLQNALKLHIFVDNCILS